MTVALAGVPPQGTYPGASAPAGRKRIELIAHDLDQDRTSMIDWYKELAAFYSPRSPRFDDQEDNRGHRRNDRILNEEPIFAKRTLVAGLHWGVSNPSRRWFEIKTGDAKLDKMPHIHAYTYEVTTRILTVLGISNFYEAQNLAYDDCATFATGAYLVEEDESDIIACIPFTVGSYAIADDHRRRVRTATRRMRLSTRQMVDEFCPPDENGVRDYSVLSTQVLQAIKDGNWIRRFDVMHVICPNPDQDDSRESPEFYPYLSVYYEQGVMPSAKEHTWLRKSGYREWPLIVFRWGRAADEAYGVNSPAMEALGTAKSLQKLESKGLKLLDKLVDPPMTGPGELEGKPTSILPGAFTATRNPNIQFKAAHDVRADGIERLSMWGEKMENRLHSIMYTKLMTMVANDARAQRATATEINEASQEKYLVLGETLERFNGSFRELIDRVFAILDRRGMLPDAPDEIVGFPLTVEYTSVMAVAQKSVGLQNLERFGITAIEFQQKVQDPALNAAVNWEAYLRALEERSGLPPGLLRTEEEVQQILEEQAMVADEARRAELAAQEAAAVRDLAGAEVKPTSALAAIAQASSSGRGGRDGSLGAMVGAPS